MGSSHQGNGAQAHRTIETGPRSLEDDSETEVTRLLGPEEAPGDGRGENHLPRQQVVVDGQAATVAQTPAEPRPVNEPQKEKKETVSWKDLPRKTQLVVITLTRLSEPLVQTSLQAYMFYQLKWFDPSLSDSVISSQAGVLHASFTAAQLLTAMMWGRVADSSRFGRKKVILIGLTGTMISCLGFGFSKTFWQALFFRCLGGVTNGNVGVLRTMISEIVREKKYRRSIIPQSPTLGRKDKTAELCSQNRDSTRLCLFTRYLLNLIMTESRAFLLLPMTFNIGVIIGPILGGVLADPAASYPDLFGETRFFLNFPYAMPNLVSAFFLLSASLTAWMCLEEVSHRMLLIHMTTLAHKKADARCAG